MGGEGSMAAANNSLKNNRSLLSKRKEKRALDGSYAHVEIKEFPKATPEQLKQIKETMQRENTKARKRQMVLLAIIISVMLFVLLNYIK